MTNTDNTLVNEIKNVYKEDSAHLKVVQDIAEQLQSEDGLKLKKNAIIEIKGDIMVPTGKINVNQKNNYLENMIFDGDQISIQHFTTKRRLNADKWNLNDNSFKDRTQGPDETGPKNIDFNTAINDQYCRYQIKKVKENDIRNRRMTISTYNGQLGIDKIKDKNHLDNYMSDWKKSADNLK